MNAGKKLLPCQQKKLSAGKYHPYLTYIAEETTSIGAIDVAPIFGPPALTPAIVGWR